MKRKMTAAQEPRLIIEIEPLRRGSISEKERLFCYLGKMKNQHGEGK